ncbi:MAG TPA: hypothetical protein VJL81_05125 [Solirubrobacterales bacterium]|nr:hypothetical protein [Solirubrobacterales bacterium]
MLGRSSRLPLFAFLALLLVAALAPAAAGAAGAAGLRWERVGSLDRPSFINGGSDHVAEILDVSHDGQTMTSTVGDSGWVSYDISDLHHPVLLAKGKLGGHATSINYTPDGKYFLVTGKGSPSYVAVYDAKTFERVRAFTIPFGPDSTAVSPDGKYAVTGIEEESNPAIPGSIVVFDLDGAPAEWTMREVAIPPDPVMAIPTDPQPEFVDIYSDDTAAITLQENNAVLMLNVPKAEIEDIWSTGSSNQKADLKGNEEVSITQPLTALREPDEISFTADGKHLLTANEGENGKGGRSVTVFDREGKLAWDSGSSPEEAEAVRGIYPDDRSSKRGSEFEGLDTAVVDGVPWGMVGSERGDAVFFFDLTDPTAPRLAGVQATTGLEPEGVLFVPQRKLAISPDAHSPGGWSFFELRDSAQAEEPHRQLLADQPWLGVRGLDVDPAGRPVVLSAGAKQRLIEVKDLNGAPSAALAFAGPLIHTGGESPQSLPERAEDVAIDPVHGTAWINLSFSEPNLYRLDGEGNATPVSLPALPPGANPRIPRGLAFSSDGSVLYIACQDLNEHSEVASIWTLYARDMQTGTYQTYKVNLAGTGAEEFFDAAITPDGEPVLLVGTSNGNTALFRVPLATANPSGEVDAVPAGTPPVGAYNESGPTGIAIDSSGDLFTIGGSSELSIDRHRFPPTGAAGTAAEGLPSPENPLTPDLSPEFALAASALSGSRLFISSGRGPMPMTAPTTGAFFSAADGATYGPSFVGGTVLTSVSDGAGGTYVGGNFTSVGGATRSHLVHLLPDGAVDPNFDPAPDGNVTALLLHGTTLYVAGEFTHIAGASRTHLAALSTVDGTLVPGFADPAPESGPHAFAYQSGKLYLGGSFLTLGGAEHHGIGRIDATTGAVDSTWSPQLVGPEDRVEALLIGANGIYLGGYWEGVDASEQQGVVLLRTTDGTVDTAFAPQFHFGGPGAFGGFALRGSQLYLTTGNAVEGLDTQQRVSRLNAATGAVDTSFQVPAPLVQNVTQPGTGPLLLRGPWLYVGRANGGEWTNRRLVRVDAATGAVDSGWNPAVTAGFATDVRTLSTTDGGVFAGGDFTAAGVERTVGAYDLQGNRFLPHLGNDDDSPELMAAAGDWIYAYYDGSVHRLDAGSGATDVGYGLSVIGRPTGLTAASGRVYLSGEFSFVGGEPRDGVAAIDAASGAILAFHPHIEGVVEAVAAREGIVYVGGQMPSVNGAPVAHLAALNATDGSSVASFHEPALPAEMVVSDLLAGSGGLFLSGTFTAIDGRPTPGLARLDPLTGAASAGFQPGVFGEAGQLIEHAGHLVAAGFFGDVEGGPAAYSLRAFDEQTGAVVPNWAPEVLGSIALYSYGTRILSVTPGGGAAYSSFDVAAPANLGAPTLAGSLRQGEAISCEPGSWKNSPTGFDYSWSLDGSPIAGESGASYTVRDGDLGGQLSCTVAGRNQAGTSVPVTSAGMTVALGLPVATAAPVLSGTPAPGQALHCSTGSWTRSPSAYAYRWLRDGAELPDTGADRVVTAEDAGHQLACRVVASNVAGAGTAIASAPLEVAAPAAPAPAPEAATPQLAAPSVPAPAKKKTPKKHQGKRNPCQGKHGKKLKACLRNHRPS